MSTHDALRRRRLVRALIGGAFLLAAGSVFLWAAVLGDDAALILFFLAPAWMPVLGTGIYLVASAPPAK